MKRMLFNATQAEELRVAIVDGQKTCRPRHRIRRQGTTQEQHLQRVITRVEPSLEAAFVDYGAERHGFLPFKEIAKQFMVNDGGEFGRSKMSTHLKVGQEMIVQVDKDERGNKGAALTTYISLAGRYLVLMPNNPAGGGVSRRIEGDDRTELREVMDQLQVPEGMSLIARTAGIGRTAEEMQWDLNYLLQLWQAIEKAAEEEKAPILIYLESSLVVRAIRDLFQPEIGEILIDTHPIYEQALSFMSTVMPANVGKVKFYRDDIPLFSRFQIEHQIESATGRDVTLPSGGAIVIDHTEALVSIDVNSARATRGPRHRADRVQHEPRSRRRSRAPAAPSRPGRPHRHRLHRHGEREEPARGGETACATRSATTARACRSARSRASGSSSSRASACSPRSRRTSHTPCPRCHGTGYIRDTASTALHVLRILQEEAMKENTAAIHAQVPVDVATYLLNEKRSEIFQVETRLKVNVLLIPNSHLETPNYQIERLRHDSPQLDSQTPSYELATVPAEEVPQLPAAPRRRSEGRRVPSRS
jgi:ribonuclease E